MGDTLRTEAVQGPVCLFSGIQEDKIAKMRDKFRGKRWFPVGRIGTRTAANRGRIGTEVTNTHAPWVREYLCFTGTSSRFCCVSATDPITFCYDE